MTETSWWDRTRPISNRFVAAVALLWISADVQAWNVDRIGAGLGFGLLWWEIVRLRPQRTPRWLTMLGVAAFATAATIVWALTR